MDTKKNKRFIINFKNFFKLLSIFLAITSFVIMACVIDLQMNLPDIYTTTVSSGNVISGPLPVIISTKKDNKFISTSTRADKCNAELLLMNVIPIKDININPSEEVTVIPCGAPFGIKLFTEGVVIVGISDVKSTNGIYNPAKIAGLKKGDIIVNINDNCVNSNEDVANILENSQGRDLDLLIKREDSEFHSKLKPVKSCDDDMYKAGIWVRDSSAGIGIMTFINPQTNVFGGLGHGICDIDTGSLLPLSHGDIISAQINGVKAGQKGNPGELKGNFCNNEKSIIGTLNKNTVSGVYGTLSDNYDCCGQTAIVAMKQQVKIGDASIITTVSGDKPNKYSIKIKSVNYNDISPTKNMIVEITDPELLNVTGGIVQGMSGSPIIQNGMLVGAITHVFVNDPKRGYAIFAENMIKTSTTVDYSDIKKAS